MISFSLFLFNNNNENENENEKEIVATMYGYKVKANGEHGGFTWYGRNDDATNAIILVDGDDVYGTIRVQGRLYQLKSLSGGLMIIVEMNESRFPHEEDPQMILPSDEELEQAKANTNANANNVNVITTIIAYTPNARRQVANINALIQLALDETNEGYALSQVDLEMVATRVYETTYTESASYSTDLTRFRTKNDGYMDEVHGFRNTDRANIAHLIVESGSSCGVASSIMATTTTAFCLTAQNCATGYYTFGHEAGHLQGARHNPEQDSSVTPFRYGHGYIIRSRFTRSIMAYDEDGEERVLRWSNPNVDYDGYQTGETDCCNNARVLNETATTVQGWCATGSCA